MAKIHSRFRKHTVGTATPLVITVVRVRLVKHNAIVKLDSGNTDGTMS